MVSKNGFPEHFPPEIRYNYSAARYIVKSHFIGGRVASGRIHKAIVGGRSDVGI